MSPNKNELGEVIARYHRGLSEGEPELVLSALGAHYYMSSGASSDDPADWQAHMFLAGQSLAQWPAAFIAEAGPYQNEFEVLHEYVRGEAALVVTSDTGGNKFRSWREEVTVWQLGRVDGEWKIVGYFVRDLANPE